MLVLGGLALCQYSHHAKVDLLRVHREAFPPPIIGLVPAAALRLALAFVRDARPAMDPCFTPGRTLFGVRHEATTMAEPDVGTKLLAIAALLARLVQGATRHLYLLLGTIRLKRLMLGLLPVVLQIELISLHCSLTVHRACDLGLLHRLIFFLLEAAPNEPSHKLRDVNVTVLAAVYLVQHPIDRHLRHLRVECANYASKLVTRNDAIAVLVPATKRVDDPLHRGFVAVLLGQRALRGLATLTEKALDIVRRSHHVLQRILQLLGRDVPVAVLVGISENLIGHLAFEPNVLALLEEILACHPRPRSYLLSPFRLFFLQRLARRHCCIGLCSPLSLERSPLLVLPHDLCHWNAPRSIFRDYPSPELCELDAAVAIRVCALEKHVCCLVGPSRAV
mmetsp:Transcript_38090/g.104844  ORF Transcript_38090/g.104844 Transcript_38090/m.104844 type:complete len:393 (-) Transcript_38090:219-1397(-)